MPRTCLLLLFFAGCAAPTPRSRNLHDGPPVRAAPVFVAPGYTPAGAGLPEYLPAAEAPTVERSPHRRLLPETPKTRQEPGLWAGDEPKAMAGRDPFPVVVGGVRMPAPDGEKSTAPMRVCADVVNRAMKKADPDFMYDYFGSLGPRQYGCAMAWLYSSCLERRAETRTRFPDAGQTVAARDAAVATKVDKCNRVDTSPGSPVALAVSGLLSDVTTGG